MTQVLPTTEGRVASLDAARGVAILGILLANITSFGYPSLAMMFTATEPELSFGEQIVEALRLAFVSGKFRSMLAVLFGVGIWMQFQKRRRTDARWRTGYAGRLLCLALIGYVHFVFIWFGDILFSYAFCAMIAMLFVCMKRRKMIWLAVGGLVVSLLLGASSLEKSSVAESFNSPTFGSFLGQFGDVGREIAIYGTEGYAAQLSHRSIFFLFSLIEIPFAGIHLIALMLIGIVLGRLRFLQNPDRYPRLVRNLLIWCLGGGLLLNMALAAWQMSGTNLDVGQLAETGLAAPLALGYLTLIAVVCRKGLNGLQKAVANVGKTALSCYLTQSLLATFIFYSWGLGLFNKLDYVQSLGVVGLIWVVNLAGSALWLRWFVMGPVEWVWRCMSLGRRLPLRRMGSSATAPAS